MASCQKRGSMASPRLSTPSKATLMLRRFGSRSAAISSGVNKVPPGRSTSRCGSTWSSASTTRKSASPAVTMGLKTRGPKRTSLRTDPPRWLMPCTSAFFTSQPAAKAASVRMSEAVSTPCPPSPATTILTTRSDMGSSSPLALGEGQWGEGEHFSYCRILPAASRHVRRVMITLKASRFRLSTRACSNFSAAATGSTTVTFGMPSDRTRSSNTILPVGAWSSVPPGAGMLLQAGHGRRAVVEDQHDVAAGRRIVDHLHQARDAAVNERAVADHADDPPGLVGGQGVAEPQAHADAGAHADQRVHRLPRRQRSQRIAADVARHDAIELLQHAENGRGAGSPGTRSAACRAPRRARAKYRRRRSAAPGRRSTRRSDTSRACLPPQCRQREVARRDTGRLPR